MRVLRWIGGKSRLIDKILQYVPEHDVFVDVFGGSGTVILSKPLVKINVYNDIDGDLANFFRVLRNKYNELEQKMKFFLYSRRDWEEYTKEIKNGGFIGDDVERAYKFFMQVNLSFNGNRESFKVGGVEKNEVIEIERLVENLEKAAKIFQKCMVENQDFEYVMRRYDSQDTFFYCDPPYVLETRHGEYYKHEMDTAEQERFLRVCLDMQGKVMISGYNHDLYDSFLKDWHKVEIPFYTAADRGKRKERIEVLWVNYEPQKNIWEASNGNR